MIAFPIARPITDGPSFGLTEFLFVTPATPGVYPGVVERLEPDLDVFMGQIGMTMDQWDVVWPAMGYTSLEGGAGSVDHALANGGISKQAIYDEFVTQFP